MFRPSHIPKRAKFAQKSVSHFSQLPHLPHIINLYVSDKPIPTTTPTAPPLARKPIFAIAIAAKLLD
ncbi:MAG: hypothetical protein K8L97_09645 [Anaerolineae bacterium]|nr:hypothetical protein [Anaerolineae bacterium]